MRRRSYSNQAFFSGLLRFTFDRNTCFGSISEQSSSLRQSHLLEISSQLMSPFTRLLAQVLSNIKSSSNKESKLRTTKVFCYLLTLDVCKTSCLRSAIKRWWKIGTNCHKTCHKTQGKWQGQGGNLAPSIICIRVRSNRIRFQSQCVYLHQVQYGFD